jgi:UDP-N-acetyl-D-glucosamine dehydrogenase
MHPLKAPSDPLAAAESSPRAEAAAPAKGLASAIADRSARVGIVGLGYVGLPLALTFAERGFPVLGFDVDGTKVERLAAGES